MLSKLEKGLSCIRENLGNFGWKDIEPDWCYSTLLCTREDGKWYAIYTFGTGRLVKYYNQFSASGQPFEIICEGNDEVSTG